MHKPLCCDHSIRQGTYKPINILQWRAYLGHLTFAVTKDVLENTRQMVKTLKSETRKYLKDYHRT